jgi:uncharacterized protein DUF4149
LIFLRFLRLLALALWTGSIFFFAAVVAPTLFRVLPTRMLAGQVVSASLAKLHWVGIICGLVYLLASAFLAIVLGAASPFRWRHILVIVMLAITLFLHYRFEPRMVRLRDSMGVIDNVPRDDPRRVEFNRMHVWSSRLEGTVLVLGLVLFYLVVRSDGTLVRRY